MKKTLIAIAALAATGAFAQSTVTISGSFEAGFVSYDMKGQKVLGVAHNMSSTSGLNFGGTSDLGGGLKANFKFGTDINPVSGAGNGGSTGNVASATGANAAAASGVFHGTASGWGAAESFLNLEGGFGKISFGSPNGLALGAHNTSQPFGTAIGSGFRSTSGMNSTVVVRYDNSVRYDTAPLFGGLTLSYLGRKQQSDAPNANYNASLGAQDQAGVSEIGASYSAGPLNFVASRTTEDGLNVQSATAGTGALTNGNKATATFLVANYTFGAATVYGGWQGSKSQNNLNAGQRDTTGMNLAVKYVMGTNTFMANVGRVGGYVGAANIGTSNSASLFGLGYEYALSKTAAVTARYERIGDNAALGVAATTGYTTVAGNNDRTRMGVGLRVSF
jgi:predicted porin